MKRTPLNESGFIPLLLTILVAVMALIYFVYSRVNQAQ